MRARKDQVPRNLERLKTRRLDELLAQRSADFHAAREAATGAVPAERARQVGLAEAAAADVRRINDEVGRRRADEQSAMRFAQAGALMDKAAAVRLGLSPDADRDEVTRFVRRHFEELAAEQERERARQEREWAEGHRQDALKARQEAIAAGRIYEPVGGWSSPVVDALGAVFSSAVVAAQTVPQYFQDADEKGVALGADDLVVLFAALVAIAENEGGEIMWSQHKRMPRLPYTASEVEGRGGGLSVATALRQLHAHGYLVAEHRSAAFYVSIGPKLEQLRDSYRQQWLVRAREQAKAERTSVADEVASWFGDVKAALGGGKDKPDGVAA